MNAAQAWGVNDPDDFDNLSKRARIKIIAWYEVKWRVDAIMAYDHQEKMRLESEKRQLANRHK